ncbi:pyridoxal-phosphate dependent enzyme [Nonomuraea spiralis]|uniref:Pyridoxal-phosphate dependent enzyme n=1 Tax=Nonomuraea spiralis TaxID=46182 RepID=A0ABV5J078_9ACTN|nr:pyridoxal-phosphate dependent enzyme [Nonomuraea spiralis]GGT40454.1 PLP-dependent lyase/thiolase [Nonomuraea spiralis]
MAHFESNVLWNPAWSALDGWAERPPDAIEHFHRSIPGFAESALVPAPAIADQVGVAHVLVKHEVERLGLPSFKVVGASWAVSVAIAGHIGRVPFPTFDALAEAAGALRASIVLSTATDGNHGRAVAYLARRLGLNSRIFVPADMAEARVDAIRGEGAEVEVVAGSYDDAVRRSAESAERDRPDGRHELLVSDTSWPGYTRIPEAVAAGYSTIFAETRRQLATELGSDASIDLALVPVGVGAFASAAVRSLASGSCSVVTAEPAAADCLWQSLAARERVTVPGPHESTMAGLNCGEVSLVAWPALQQGVRAATRVSDLEVAAAVRDLAALGVATSESGAAGLAGLRRLRLDSRAGSLLRPRSTLVLFDTEGVTDPAGYEAILAGSSTARGRTEEGSGHVAGR